VSLAVESCLAPRFSLGLGTFDLDYDIALQQRRLIHFSSKGIHISTGQRLIEERASPKPHFCLIVPEVTLSNHSEQYPLGMPV
jgi:hypothetical protein